MVISYRLTASRRVMASPPVTVIPRPIIPPMNRNLTFQDVQMEHIYQNCWTIHARVEWKTQIKENGNGNVTFNVYYWIRMEQKWKRLRTTTKQFASTPYYKPS